ncbi:hypothetical protein KGY71_02380 [Candidatus Bipolaricaulota bacterium]|nr:hypothetical protein [Candidatus Bipolaricaulota bacterium]
MYDTVTTEDQTQSELFEEGKSVEVDQRLVERVQNVADRVLERIDEELEMMENNTYRAVPVERTTKVSNRIAWEVAKRIRTGEFPEKFADKQGMKCFLELYRADNTFEANRTFKKIVKMEKEREVIKEINPRFRPNVN